MTLQPLPKLEAINNIREFKKQFGLKGKLTKEDTERIKITIKLLKLSDEVTKMRGH